ncbi:hypothetical protein [Acetobacter cerevisiae]|uniref:hypothetical protein n=1 Tax=Acetobacter cerevisiae TaxID=178900 RepID=UPI000A4B4578|nr:hypothetical protein [Acetobacter cerevisiae]
MGQSFSYLMKFYAPFPGRINSQKEYSALFQGFGVFLAIILFFLVSSGAAQHIYFEHDDWDFMTKLAPGMVPYASPWQKTLFEGRWVNWVWSLQANNLPARFIYCLYMLGYCLLCWLSSCLISSKFFYRMLRALLEIRYDRFSRGFERDSKAGCGRQHNEAAWPELHARRNAIRLI